jgi:hypothetical protein
LSSPGGEDAFELKLKEKYLRQMQFLADGTVDIILPGALNNYESWVENLGIKSNR